MSRACRVAVRIVRRGDAWHVIGRETRVECATSDEAWAASVPYFRGYTMHPDGRYEVVR